MQDHVFWLNNIENDIQNNIEYSDFMIFSALVNFYIFIRD